MIADLCYATGIKPFIDGEGGIFDLNDGSCPRCAEPATSARRVQGSGYFNCPNCNLTFDEPMFAAPSAFLGYID